MNLFRSNTNASAATLITEKQSQLEMLQRDSENAVGIITSTISRLENVNQQIVEKREEIEQYQNELARLDGNMSQQYDHNAKIVAKFKNFLED